MSSKVAVVIPTYKEELDELEKISLAQVRKVLGKYPLIFVAPEGKNLTYLEKGNGTTYFPPQFFKSVESYSRLLMSPQFYRTFSDFDYILIYQLDAFVFYDALEYFCSLGYDYIGAPWPYYARRNIADKKNLRVGNGGLCLRNVKSHYNLFMEHADLAKRMMGTPEDDFFAYCGAREDINFSVPPVEIAAKFSVEYLLKHSLKNIRNKLPFGCHGWSKMSADFYVNLFFQLGYDLRPLRNKMMNLDYNILQGSLIKFSMQRLIRRVNRGQALMRYLPKNHFASVRVIRSPSAMIIFARLILENPHLADEIYFYDESEQDILISDLTLKKEPHLIITFGSYFAIDEFLISSAQKKGISYGKRIVSFWREYINSCEKLLHNLGK